MPSVRGDCGVVAITNSTLIEYWGLLSYQIYHKGYLNVWSDCMDQLPTGGKTPAKEFGWVTA